MNITVLKAEQRARLDLGWLVEYSSFGRFDFDRLQGQFVPTAGEHSRFGCLERLVDAVIQVGGHGLPTHRQTNREILSIVLQGRMWHQDSAGNYVELPAGSVQLLSAGQGLYHSAFNHCREHDCHVLQIWLSPNERDTPASYQRALFPDEQLRNQLRPVACPDGRDGALRIRQNAYGYYGLLEAGCALQYPLRQAGTGVYVLVLDGRARVAGQELGSRDAATVTGAPAVHLEALERARLLLLEVPLCPAG